MVSPLAILLSYPWSLLTHPRQSEPVLPRCPGKVQGLLSQVLQPVRDMASYLSFIHATARLTRSRAGSSAIPPSRTRSILLSRQGSGTHSQNCYSRCRAGPVLWLSGLQGQIFHLVKVARGKGKGEHTSFTHAVRWQTSYEASSLS